MSPTQTLLEQSASIVHGSPSPPQGSPVRGFASSVIPSQSSSMPLQTSVPGPLPPEQTRLPAVQTFVPGMHAPTLDPQGVPASVGLSSIIPLQSSSTPLQISGMLPGTTPGVEHAQPVRPSSMLPLQSSSMPLHTSGPGMPPFAQAQF